MIPQHKILANHQSVTDNSQLQRRVPIDNGLDRSVYYESCLWKTIIVFRCPVSSNLNVRIKKIDLIPWIFRYKWWQVFTSDWLVILTIRTFRYWSGVVYLNVGAWYHTIDWYSIEENCHHCSPNYCCLWMIFYNIDW